MLINSRFYQESPLCRCRSSSHRLTTAFDFCAGICEEGKALPFVYSTFSPKKSERYKIIQLGGEKNKKRGKTHRKPHRVMVIFRARGVGVGSSPRPPASEGCSASLPLAAETCILHQHCVCMELFPFFFFFMIKRPLLARRSKPNALPFWLAAALHA